MTSFKIWLQFIVFKDLCVTRTEQYKTTETCADLQIIGDSNISVIDVREDSYVNIGFMLMTGACEYTPDWFRVKASAVEGGLHLPFCSILFNNTTCVVTGASPFCRCNGQKSGVITKTVSPSDKAYILEWTDSKTLQAKKVKTIFLNVPVKKPLKSLLIILAAAGSGLCVCIFIIVIVCVMRLRVKKKVKLSSEQSSEHSSKQSSNEAWQKQGEGEDLYENEEELTGSFRNVSYPRACRSSASEKVHDYVEPVLDMTDVLLSLKKKFQQRR